ncbi:MAG: glycosyltransferase [Vicingus serpentipes]|nr:glycosyltransferase [Vicingus serpentipes]
MNNDQEIFVDVITCAYNHENFISQCIESVLNQKTSFKFRYIIGEDCSKDNTRKIIEEYFLKHKDIIVPVYHKNNLGPSENTRELFSLVKAKYVAFIDGDDYWCDSLKLQRQVDFLENNSDYAACYHGCKFVDENNLVIKESKSKQYSSFNKDELLCSEGALITNTVLFRNELDFPEFMEKVPNGDAFFWHLIGFHGHAKFLPEIKFSAYRVHSSGIWTSSSNLQRLENYLITKSYILKNIIVHFPDNKIYAERLKKTVINEFVSFFYRQLYAGNYVDYIRGYVLLFKFKQFNKWCTFINHISDLSNRLFNRK